MNPSDLKPLPPGEQIAAKSAGRLATVRLIELEAIIEAGQKTFIEVGLALAEIRDCRLYKADFKTFEEYCRIKWGFSRQHCYRLIECAPIAKCHPQVTSLNQARALVKVPEGERVTVINTATTKAKAENRPLTAKDIQMAASPCLEPADAACVRSETPEPITANVKTPEEIPVSCPRAKTRSQVENWYINASSQKRGKFLNLIFSYGDVRVEDKDEFKKRVDQWFENSVIGSGGHGE